MTNSDNPAAGAQFEIDVADCFRSHGLDLKRGFDADIGVSNIRKSHKFDLGQSAPLVLVECKRHTWTKGGNAPSAKMSVWNEAMLYFSAVHQKARKILVVLRSVRRGETLGQYYLKRFQHLIPGGVEVWEFDSETSQGVLIYPL